MYQYVVLQRCDEMWHVLSLDGDRRNLFSGTREKAIDFSIIENAKDLPIVVKPLGCEPYVISNKGRDQPW